MKNSITFLITMNPHSVMKLGIASKIVFDSSASLIANGATFTSLDSNETWDGFYLYHKVQDSCIRRKDRIYIRRDDSIFLIHK